MHIPEIGKEREKLSVCINTFKLFSQKFSKLPLMFNALSYLLAWPLNSSLINPGISWNFWNSLPALVVLEPCHEERNPEAAFRLNCHLQAKQWSFGWNITDFFLKKNITSPVLGSTQLRCLHGERVHITAPHLSSFCSHRSPRWPLDAGQSSVVSEEPCSAGAWLSWFR